jgi:hypothetical protein
MTKVSKAAGTETANPLTAGFDSFASFTPIRETAMKVWFDFGAEALQFMSSRIVKDMEIQQEMLACKRLEDIQKVQAKFFSKAIEDYNAEVARMMKIMSTTMSQDPSDAKTSTDRDYDDVPL